MQDALAPIVVDLLGMLPKTDRIFVFSSGNLRGELRGVSCTKTFPAATYDRGPRVRSDVEDCFVIEWTPRPKDASKVDFNTKFHRKPVSFAMPIGVVDAAVYLDKIEDGKWMLNVNTSIKS